MVIIMKVESSSNVFVINITGTHVTQTYSIWEDLELWVLDVCKEKMSALQYRTILSDFSFVLCPSASVASILITFTHTK